MATEVRPSKRGPPLEQSEVVARPVPRTVLALLVSAAARHPVADARAADPPALIRRRVGVAKCHAHGPELERVRPARGVAVLRRRRRGDADLGHGADARVAARVGDPRAGVARGRVARTAAPPVQVCVLAVDPGPALGPPLRPCAVPPHASRPPAQSATPEAGAALARATHPLTVYAPHCRHRDADARLPASYRPCSSP